MLGEIVELMRLLLPLSVIPPDRRSYACRLLFGLYQDLGLVIEHSNTALRRTLANRTQFVSRGGSVEDWERVVNSQLDELDHAIHRFVRDFGRASPALALIAPGLEEDLTLRFGLKRWWFHIFERAATVGRVFESGTRLRAASVRIGSRLEPFAMDPTEEFNWVTETIDNIDDGAVRRAFVDVGRANIKELERLRTELGDVIRDTCRVEDIL